MLVWVSAGLEGGNLKGSVTSSGPPEAVDESSLKEYAPVYVSWVPYHGMTSPQVADGEVGLQLWR
jgi:hypothetical protein